ncbi:LytR/AlgR family response regulator transcription factor [Flavobacterium ajazii]|uniref:LytR/AlgR family response regulator transcription factor n=1 Tax=Flavobacterium ajazii TaxID=2692318 RepID=UPI0013D0947B|nr:LytTR family DNA-binding domain-containing protein [Flavobacterium ajazii]
MYKAVIIDDEEMARTLLNGMLAEYCKNVEVVDLCKDLPCGVKSIRKNKPDIVFLDIEMPGHSGLELLDFFDESEVDFSIIFVTAYNRYAIQAFKLSAVDYLLKPIETQDLIDAVSLFEKQKEKKQYNILKENLASPSKKIGLNNVSSISFVELDLILFFQADGSYTKVILKDGKTIIASKSLKHFENVLIGNSDFYRCHKSYIVNINHISEYIKSDGGSLRLGSHEIGISIDKVSILLEKMGL